MNLTGGIHRGRKVKTVKSNEVRPTSSKVRESIFNIIQNRVKDAVMLDLFAGSGIMGLEAFSRGAKKIVYVEKSPKIIKNLEENLSQFDLDYQLLKTDALKALDLLKGTQFDIIFADPPYAAGLIEHVLAKIKENNLIADEGIIIIEHDSSLNIDATVEEHGFAVSKAKTYGDTALTFIKREIVL